MGSFQPLAKPRGMALGLVILSLVLFPGEPAARAQLPPAFADAVPQGPEEAYSGDKITLSLRDADLVEVLRSFARMGDFNMLLHPGIQGTVTVELTDVPWDQAMAVILKMQGLAMELSGGTLRIAPIGALADMARREAEHPTPQVIPTYKVSGELRHLDPHVLARWLRRPDNDRLGPRGRVQVAADGALTLEDVKPRLRPLARMVAALDRPEAESWGPDRLAREAEAWWRRNVGSGGF